MTLAFSGAQGLARRCLLTSLIVLADLNRFRANSLRLPRIDLVVCMLKNECGKLMANKLRVLMANKLRVLVRR